MLDHIVVKSERCQKVLVEAMDHSGDENDLTGKVALVNLTTLMTFWEANGAIWKTLNKPS